MNKLIETVNQMESRAIEQLHTEKISDANMPQLIGVITKGKAVRVCSTAIVLLSFLMNLKFF